MSAAMSSCGAYGWVTDRHGYRYSPQDPQTKQPWPAMPALFAELAERAAQRLNQEWQPNQAAPTTLLAETEL